MSDTRRKRGVVENGAASGTRGATAVASAAAAVAIPAMAAGSSEGAVASSSNKRSKTTQGDDGATWSETVGSTSGNSGGATSSNRPSKCTYAPGVKECPHTTVSAAVILSFILVACFCVLVEICGGFLKWNISLDSRITSSNLARLSISGLEMPYNNSEELRQ